jgi:hypothetical protein
LYFIVAAILRPYVFAFLRFLRFCDVLEDKSWSKVLIPEEHRDGNHG